MLLVIRLQHNGIFRIFIVVFSHLVNNSTVSDPWLGVENCSILAEGYHATTEPSLQPCLYCVVNFLIIVKLMWCFEWTDKWVAGL